MIFKPKNLDWKKSFAILPVKVQSGEVVMLGYVERRWTQNLNLCLIDPFDIGEYVGGWEYRLIKERHHGKD